LGCGLPAHEGLRGRLFAVAYDCFCLIWSYMDWDNGYDNMDYSPHRGERRLRDGY